MEKKAQLILEAAKPPSRAPSEFFPVGSFGHFVFNIYCPRTYAGAEQTTIELYDNYLRKHILPVLGWTPISLISYDDFIKLEAGLKNARYPKRLLAIKTKREIMMRTHEIMNLHVLMEKGKGETAREDWRLHKAPKAPPKKRREEVDPDFSVKLLAAAAGTWLEGPLFCALFLALRRGEILGLKTTALDRKRHRIQILEQSHPKLKPGALPKGGKTRDIPVPDEVLVAIDRIRDKSSLHLWTKDGKEISADDLSHAVPDLCISAGLPRKTLHELRALAASNLLGIGANPVAVMEILGHAKLDTSLIYFDPHAAEKRNAFAALLKGERPALEEANRLPVTG